MTLQLEALYCDDGDRLWRALLAFAGDQDVAARPDGTGRVVIDGYGYNPTWSSDGRRLIYIKDASATSWRLMRAPSGSHGTADLLKNYP
jgi:hypothetical protein